MTRRDAIGALAGDINVALQNPNFLHQLARRYGVQYVVAGHIHQMLLLEVEGVTYVSMASSGGHLRLSGAYEDGWFFGHALVEVKGTSIEYQIKEVGRYWRLTSGLQPSER